MSIANFKAAAFGADGDDDDPRASFSGDSFPKFRRK